MVSDFPFRPIFKKTLCSTTTALVKIADEIRLGMNQQLTVLTLLEFSNAFIALNFDILLALLGSLGIF